MQVRHDDRRTEEVVRITQYVVVRGVLLVRTQHHRLQRRVASLDQVTVLRRVRRQPIRYGDHQRVPARPQALVERADVQQHPVAGDRRTDQVRVGQSAHSLRTDRHSQFNCARPSSARPHAPHRHATESHGDSSATGTRVEPVFEDFGAEGGF